jgi:serine/threonine protein kinase
VGTPGYMAPEVERGETGGEAADVFALGAILRFLLTGSPSCGAPARDVRMTLPLTAICARATAADPAQRYPGAASLAADLASYRGGLAVAALPDGWVRRVARFVRRHSTAILLLLAYLLMRLVLLLLLRR